MRWFTKALADYATFTGRARRTEFWMFTLLYAIFYLVCVLLDVVVMSSVGISFPILAAVFVLGMLVPSLAVAVRRLHDTDRSGWWYLIGLVPIVGAIVLLVFFCLEGTRGPNRFGADPRAGVVDQRSADAGPMYA